MVDLPPRRDGWAILPSHTDALAGPILGAHKFQSRGRVTEADERPIRTLVTNVGQSPMATP